MVKTKKQLGSITFKTVNFKIIGPVLESGIVVERVAKSRVWNNLVRKKSSSRVGTLFN